MELLPDSLLTLLQKQDMYHPSGPGRELEPHEYKVLAKYFTPDASWTWYAVSASKDEKSGDVQFFGLVDGLELEYGYFWLSELQGVRGTRGLGVERDLYWEPITLDKLDEQLRRERGEP